jgi:hypothetical protein
MARNKAFADDDPGWQSTSAPDTNMESYVQIRDSVREYLRKSSAVGSLPADARGELFAELERTDPRVSTFPESNGSGECEWK